MLKKLLRALLFSAAISLCLTSNASLAFAQCGLPGTAPCGKKKTKIITNSSSTSIKISSSKEKLYKSGSTFVQKSGSQFLLVKYTQKKSELVFLVEALSYFSTEKTGEVHIYIDINRNGKIDVSDIIYKIIRDLDGVKLESKFLSDKNFDSTAVVGYSFMSTKDQSRLHPVWSIKIPKKEIFNKVGELNLRFEYWSETCLNCVIRIPQYDVTSVRNTRDANGLLDFGPVKKIKFDR